MAIRSIVRATSRAISRAIESACCLVSKRGIPYKPSSFNAPQEPVDAHAGQTRPLDVLDGVAATQGHAAAEVFVQQVQHLLDAGLAVVREAPDGGAADPDAAGAEGEGDEDVGALAEAPVDVDGDAAAGGVDALDQGVDGRRDAVKLATPVVADDDAVAAVLDRQLRVLGRQDALDPDLHLGLGAEPGNVPLPAVGVVVERRKARVVRLAADLGRRQFQGWEFQPVWCSEVVAPLVVPHSQHGGVGREENGFASGCLGLLEDAFLQRLVLHHVELHGVVDVALASRDDFIHRVIRKARDRHVDAHLGTRPANRQFSRWMGHCLYACWGDGQGKLDLAVEAGRGGGHLGHINQHARPQAILAEGRVVLRDGALVRRARVEKVCTQSRKQMRDCSIQRSGSEERKPTSSNL